MRSVCRMNVEVLVTGFGPSGRVLIGLISGATLPHIKYVLKSENSNNKNITFIITLK